LCNTLNLTQRPSKWANRELISQRCHAKMIMSISHTIYHSTALSTSLTAFNLLNSFILTHFPATSPLLIHACIQPTYTYISRVSLHSALSLLLQTHIRAKRRDSSSQCPPVPTPASCSCSCSCSCSHIYYIILYYIYIYIHTYIYVYVRTHTHTHTNT